MLLSALISKIRVTLQDVTPRRWTDLELEGYINEGIKDISRKVLFNRVDEDITIIPPQTNYTLTYKAIRIYSIDTLQEYTVTNNNTIVFDEPLAETFNVSYYAYLADVSVVADSTIPLEDDLIEALKYFALKRAYEKEDSTENFGKASYFNNEYRETLADASTRWHNDLEVPLAKQDYYD